LQINRPETDKMAANWRTSNPRRIVQNCKSQFINNCWFDFRLCESQQHGLIKRYQK